MALERALLTHDVLVSSSLFALRLPKSTETLQKSDPLVRKRFTQRLVLLGLNSLRNYSSCEALELLSKDQADLLQPFQKCYTDPFKALSESKALTKTLHGSELQIISLVRGLLELCGGTNFARGGDMMFENQGTGNTRLYCRRCVVGCCYEHADTRCGGWQVMKPWRRHNFGAMIVT